MTPCELHLSFPGLYNCAKFNKIQFEIATTEVMTDRQTETDAGDLIICPMLCNSKGTDNNFIANYYGESFYVLHLYRTVADIIIHRTVAGKYKLWL